MNSYRREYILYLEDIFTSMSRIEEYLGDLDFKTYKSNNMLVDAIVRNFEIIAEASKNIPANIKEKYPESKAIWKNQK